MATAKEEFARDMVQTTSLFLLQYQRFRALSDEWTKLGYGQGAPAEITDSDLAGLNTGLCAADLAAGLVTLDAITALMDAGHGTNLYRLFRRNV